MKLVRNAGQHSYGPPVDGLRHCTLCEIAEPCLVDQFQCSGVKGMFGRPVFAEDLTGRGIASEPRLEDPASGGGNLTLADPRVLANGEPVRGAAPRPVKNRRGAT